MNWDAAGVTLLLKEMVHSSWSSCNFSLARNMHFLLPLMSKGTWMVSTSVWMLRLMQSVWCQDRVIWANPVLICCSHLSLWWAKQWEAVGKTESFTISEVSIFSGCLMQSCHKPSFFSCSYVTKKIIFQGPTPNQFGQNPLYRAKSLHSSMSVTSNLGYLYSQGICHLGGLWFIIHVLTTLTGFEARDPTSPQVRHERKWVHTVSPIRPERIRCFLARS